MRTRLTPTLRSRTILAMSMLMAVPLSPAAAAAKPIASELIPAAQVREVIE